MEQNSGQTCQNWGPKLVFSPFSRLWSLVFLSIADDDNLENCPTNSRNKTHKKIILPPKLRHNRPKSGPK